MKLTALPKFSSYGPYGGNYGVHCITFDVGPVKIWYSYQTVVAFHIDGYNRVVLQNRWKSTTGKHLNAIDGGDRAKKRRVSQDEFDRLWAEQTKGLFGQKAA